MEVIRVCPCHLLLTERPCLTPQGAVVEDVSFLGRRYRQSRLCCVTLTEAEIVGVSGPAIVPLEVLPPGLRREAMIWLEVVGLSPQPIGAN
jgi:hypothetical protein